MVLPYAYLVLPPLTFGAVAWKGLTQMSEKRGRRSRNLHVVGEAKLLRIGEMRIEQREGASVRLRCQNWSNQYSSHVTPICLAS